MAAKSGFDKAQYNVGKMYRDGRGVAKDVEASARWFLMAAKQGYAKAQRNLGRCYMRGEGVKRDEAAALMWFSLAAKGGATGAAKNRDALAAKLPETIRQKVDGKVRNWRPSLVRQ